MYLKIFIIHSVLITGLISFELKYDEKFFDKCVESIYQKCTHRSEFTEEEVENARQYIQHRFMSLPVPLRPTKPPCKRLRVRRDFKCLSHDERMDVMHVFRVLYESGYMTKMAEVHWRYWGQTHKFADFILWHRWFTNELEKQMRLINPEVTLPYWSNFEEYDQPHFSYIWDYMGRAGNKLNDHCIVDTVLANMSVGCVRRQWINDLYIQSWDPIEYVDSVLQTARSLPDWFTMFNSPHFKVHLNVGGWMGQMSVTDAPYDLIFYPYHEWLTELAFFRWQLQDDRNLVADTYNTGLVYDLDSDRIRRADLGRDRIPVFNVSVLEVFHVGFGDLCHVLDDNVRAINQVIGNERPEVPPNYRHIPDYIAEKYYPRFRSGNYTAFDFVSRPSAPVQCNRGCRPMNHPLDFVSTLSGRRLIRLYKTAAGLDIADEVKDSEFEHNEFIADMNSVGYCSPYIIS